MTTANTHGTGCSLSAAIAAGLARGDDVPGAVAAAKEFVHDALVGGATWQLGRGHGPLDHLGWSATDRRTYQKWPGRNDPATFSPQSQDRC